MKKPEEFIDKLNFKKTAITCIVILGMLLLVCLSIMAYLSRDKIFMFIDYEKVADRFEKEGVNDKLETQLQKLASDSRDINNVIILNKKNTIIFKANNNLIGDKTKLQLIPNEAGVGYLHDKTNPDRLFKVVKQENLILDYIPDDLHLGQVINDELSYEIDFSTKEVYLLNYLIDRNTQSKILMIRTVNPIPYAEKLLEVTGELLGLIMAFYWVGLALWVYQDARRKKLNASLWGLLILITNLVGFIVYLIYKQNNLTCYKCGALQSKSNAFCSNCGTRINESCHNCQATIITEDNYCSRCGSKIE